MRSIIQIPVLLSAYRALPDDEAQARSARRYQLTSLTKFAKRTPRKPRFALMFRTPEVVRMTAGCAAPG
jgi:hypothetical protein